MLFIIGTDWFFIDSVLKLTSLKITRRSNANQNGLSWDNNWEGGIHASGFVISFELFNTGDWNS